MVIVFKATETSIFNTIRCRYAILNRRRKEIIIWGIQKEHHIDKMIVDLVWNEKLSTYSTY